MKGEDKIQEEDNRRKSKCALSKTRCCTQELNIVERHHQTHQTMVRTVYTVANTNQYDKDLKHAVIKVLLRCF